MELRRVGPAALVGAVGLAVLVDPVAAQSAADTTTEALINDLNDLLLVVGIPIAVLVEGILIYTVWKYRNNDEAKPTPENRGLEIGWTIATAVILVAVGVAAYGTMSSAFVSAESNQALDTEQDPVEIKVVAQKYFWTFEYPNETVREVTGNESATGFSNPNTLVMPTDRPVELNITSKDWLHAFHAPEMGLKQDAFPGQWNTLLTQANNEGKFQLYCAEYCGAGHSNMFGTVDVRDPGGFEEWVTAQTGG
ncbi:MAG: cytochrome c oxidase subunit 2 [Salinirussus sp.]|jgi:cytochrome c oxidase subunit 2